PGEHISKSSFILDLLPRTLSFASPSAPPGPLMGLPPFYHGASYLHGGAYPYYGVFDFQEHFVLNPQALDRAERLTVRGILAMEVGNSVAALNHFQEALNLAGPQRLFAGRGVAERYTQLLEAGR